jgi:HPt (histidine-containing phosphotransfer) domain-containing protein
MKSINQIFENNKDVINNKSVIELINYCHQLEDEIILIKQNLSKDDLLLDLVREIYYSLIDIISKDKNNNNDNYYDMLKNLKNYISSFSKDYNIKI